MERSGKPRFRRHIYQKIGFGYLLAIATGFVGSISGMLLADYYQGLAIIQLTDAQIQSTLLEQLKDQVLETHLHGLQVVHGMDDVDWLQSRCKLLKEHVQYAEQLTEELQAFLEHDPSWLATDQPTLQTLLNRTQLALQAYSLLVEAQLDTLQTQVPQPRTAPSAAMLRAIARSPEARQLAQISQELAALQATAEGQEKQAGDILEQTQGLEKLMIVVSASLAVLVAGWMAWRTTRSIARPIVQITKLAERAAEEEQFNLIIPTTGDDEIASLAQSLNHLIQKVAVHNQDLHQATIAADDRAQQLQKLLNELQAAQTQLIQTEKMSSLGQLVAGIAHEINNPLTFIRGNLEYAQDYTFDLLRLASLCNVYEQSLTPEVKQHLDHLDLEFLQRDLPRIFASMRTGSDRIRAIVQSLRSFSRFDEMGIKAADLHEGIDSTLTLLSNRLRETRHRPAIQIIRDYAELPLVECHIGQINQVFMNVLTNAINAIDEFATQDSSQGIFGGLLGSLSQGEKFIRITTLQPQAEWVTVQISNNGPLIPESHQSKLFDPFYTTKPPGQGTGNGLFICYQIVVEQHRGRLWCRSEPTTGVTFGIELPVKLSYQAAARQPSQPAQASTALLP